jgi:uncharacterized protein YjiS (DUF1127 family)
MATAYTAANLVFRPAKQAKKSSALRILLRFEAWLDRRASRKVLYQMDDHMLSDIGLSRADVEGMNTSFWQDDLPSPR